MIKERIRRRIIIPVALFLLALNVVTVVGFYHYQKAQTKQEIQKNLKSVNEIFQQEIKDDSQSMDGLLDFIKKDKNLQNAWLAKDRDELLKYSMPIFEHIRSESNITHFYFHGLDKINFLRVHKPSSYGDFIDRFTMREASEKQITSNGIELGPYGTFTLRVVNPWLINGELTGYIELGEEIGHLTPKLKKTLGVELIFVISKKYLNHSKWEEGQKLMLHTADWDSLKDYVFIDSTIDFNKTLIPEINQHSHSEHANISFNYSHDNRSYIGGFVPLTDVGGLAVGDIIILKDITEINKSMLKLTSVVFLISILTGLALIMFFYIYLGNIENKISKLHNDLEIQIDMYKKGEKGIKKQYDLLKLSEESLKKSEKKYYNLIENANDAIVTVNDKGLIVDFNAKAEEIYGYDRKEVLGKSVIMLVPPELRKRQENALGKIAETKQLRLGRKTMEATGFKKNGEKFPVETSVFETELQGEYFFTSFVRDITERKIAEKEIRGARDFLESVIENSRDGILITDEKGNIISLNNAMEKMTGFTKTELIGKHASIFTVDDKYIRNTVMEKSFELYEKGYTFYQTFHKNKDGRTIEVECNISLVKDDEGNTTAGVAIIRDITERKQIEDKLVQAQKMEAIGTLAGGVAHDLNNILGAIVGYPDLLLDGMPEDSPMRSSILAIKKSGERAAAIVQDLLTLTRRGVKITEVLNLKNIIDEYLGSFEYKKLKEFHPYVVFDSKLETKLLNIAGSPVQLSKVIMNLVSNAAEAMPHGGKVLISSENIYLSKAIKGYDTVEAGDYVVLTVSDNGIGISEKDIGKIFEPFYSKKVMGRSGTGLGMSVVWGTVKDHKGYIDVESAEGLGTTFKIYFPVIREDIQKNESAFSFEEYRGNGEKILAVDDMDSQREIAEVLLKKLNYNVQVLKSGEEAVEYMKNNTADLLILDMMMEPGMDGLDTYKKIIETNPGQKAIIASGYSETDRVKEAQMLGVGEYIKKPYTLEKIGLAVKKALSKKS